MSVSYIVVSLSLLFLLFYLQYSGLQRALCASCCTRGKSAKWANRGLLAARKGWEWHSQAIFSPRAIFVLGSCSNTTYRKVACVFSVCLFAITTENKAVLVALKQNLWIKMFQLFQVFSSASIHFESTQQVLLVFISPFSHPISSASILWENTNNFLSAFGVNLLFLWNSVPNKGFWTLFRWAVFSVLPPLVSLHWF